MLTINARAASVLATLVLLMGLAACSEPEQDRQVREPVAFNQGDECHVCGMVITNFPGPKGQAAGEDGVRKFCSTAEMLGWWLQPENQQRDLQLYVHDMGRSDWNHPDDRHLIDARTAWYVAGTPLKGAMGAVFASFSDEQEARLLAEEKGGQILRLDEISQEMLRPEAFMPHNEPGMSHSSH